MAIHLIRHGETDANAARIVQRPTVPLSARGRAQAEAVARRLAVAGVVAIRASDLARAAETAAAIARATGAPLSWDADLHERNYGDVRGTPYAALREDIFGPDYAPPGGETWAAFHARVDGAWARVVTHATRLAAGRQPADAAGDLVVVTHGLVCRRILAAHLDPPPGCDVDRTAWENTSVTTIVGPDWRRIDGLACVAHLDGVPAGAPV